MNLSYFEKTPRLEIKPGGHHQRRSKATNHVRDVRTAANVAAALPTRRWQMEKHEPQMDSEHHVRLTAYRLWEEAGRPMGEADRHWAMAQDIERARQAAKRPLGASRQKKRSVTKN
jgi:hypothetical protein